MKRFLIALAIAVFALLAAAALAQPTTPINNPRLQGTGTVTGTLAPSGSGVITASVQQTLDLLSTTRGAIIYRGASGWVVLAPGPEAYVLASGGAGEDPFWIVQGGGVPGSGTVTSIADGNTNGIAWTVATRTTTPVFTFSLGNITPASIVATGTISGSNLSGTNTGDQTNITGNAGTATALQNARTINGTSFDGTSNITVTAAAGTLSGSSLAPGVTGSSLLSAAGGTFGTAAFTAANAYEPALGNPSVTGYVLSSTTGGVRSWVVMSGGGGGSGTVTSVSVVSANGISGSVATDTTTPAITLSLGHITPTSVNSVVISGSGTPTLAVSGTTSVSGANTGDQTSVSGNAGTATKLATARNINGVSFDGTASITVTADAGTLSGSSLASGVTGSSLTSAAGGTFGTAAFTAANAYEAALGNPGVSGYVLSSTTGGVRSWVAMSGGGGSTAWGDITGTLSLQADLKAALDAKLAANSAITAETKTKIAYDANGLVIAGADATTADIADSTNKRYVTDAQLTVIGNTSGTNTGDQTSVSGNAGTATALQTARTINGTSFDGTANITVTAAAGTLTGTALNSTVVTSSLTSVGTISTGVWQGTIIDGARGGMGVSATGATGVPIFALGSATITGTTGSGNVVRATSATLVSPTIGAASATSINKVAITAPATGATLTIADGKTATVNNTLTLVGTDGTTITFPDTSQTVAGLTATQTVTKKQILDDAALGTDDTWEGSAITGLNAGATIAQWDAVYLGGSSTWLLADSDGSGTYPARGLAVAAYSSTNAAVVVTKGAVRNDSWTWTPGGTIYISATPGGLTQTAPSTSTHKIQQVGFALTADVAYFNFASGEYLTVE